MSDQIRSQTIVNPDMDDLLEELKNEIFANLNCIQIGKIESYNKDEQTVEVQIQVKRRVGENEIKDYPLLVDCPVYFLQGGGAYIDMPIKKDDFCLILFNDRNIDNWWDSTNVTEPLNTRKHDLSDGFVLVGINPKSSVLDLNGEKVRIIATGFPLDIETDQDVNIRTDTKIVFNDGTDFAVRYNELKQQLDNLKQDFNNFVSTYTGHTHVVPPAGFTVSGVMSGPSTISVGGSGTAVVTTAAASPTTVDFSNTKVDDVNLPGVGE